MLDKHSKSNIATIMETSPSLYVCKEINKDVIRSISLSLYINLNGQYYVENEDDYYPSSIETIAHLLVTRQEEKINNHPVYKISGTAGAITGFGSAIYESMMIELSKIENGALLISDRESITGSAESLYHKMKKNAGFGCIPISHNNSNFSFLLEHDIFPEILSEAGIDEETSYDEYLIKIQSGEVENYVLNNAYFRHHSVEYEHIHELMINNHVKRQLSSSALEEIIQDGEYIGEYLEEIQHVCKKDIKNNFSLLLRDIAPKDNELSL